jgi:hypothetical protein
MPVQIEFIENRYHIIYGVRDFAFDNYCDYLDFFENCFLVGWPTEEQTKH